jgi:hypothetical protein
MDRALLHVVKVKVAPFQTCFGHGCGGLGACTGGVWRRVVCVHPRDDIGRPRCWPRAPLRLSIYLRQRLAAIPQGRRNLPITAQCALSPSSLFSPSPMRPAWSSRRWSPRPRSRASPRTAPSSRCAAAEWSTSQRGCRRAAPPMHLFLRLRAHPRPLPPLVPGLLRLHGPLRRRLFGRAGRRHRPEL